MIIKAGYYQTRDGHLARVDRDFTARGGLAVIPEMLRYVAYTSTGEFAFKDEDFSPDPNPGDSFDLVEPISAHTAADRLKQIESNHS